MIVFLVFCPPQGFSLSTRARRSRELRSAGTGFWRQLPGRWGWTHGTCEWNDTVIRVVVFFKYIYIYIERETIHRIWLTFFFYLLVVFVGNMVFLLTMLMRRMRQNSRLGWLPMEKSFETSETKKDSIIPHLSNKIRNHSSSPPQSHPVWLPWRFCARQGGCCTWIVAESV